MFNIFLLIFINRKCLIIKEEIYSAKSLLVLPLPLQKKRKPNRPEHTEYLEHIEEISLSSIQEILDKISKQQSNLDMKVNEILDRVIRIEEDRIVDQEFINVLNLFN